MIRLQIRQVTANLPFLGRDCPPELVTVPRHQEPLSGQEHGRRVSVVGRAVNKVWYPSTMPVSYRIDLHAGVVFTVFEGRLTNEELLGHQPRVSADPDFRPTMNRVIDFRGVRDVTITAFAVRSVATRHTFASGSRCAIIAGDATSYGYIEMFQTLRSQSGEDIKIFSTVEDAHRWLGLE
jgi:hypothetical protein